MQKIRVLITAGGTREFIDPVRFISNKSSGKMGISLADEAHARNFEVILISDKTPDELNDKPYETVQIENALELQEAIDKKFNSCQIIIMCSAVADYRPAKFSSSKIKKENFQDLKLELVRNPDILKSLGEKKTDQQLLIGFCAETENLRENASKKLQAKNLDLIIANYINNKTYGMNSDYNEILLLPNKNINKNTNKNIQEKFFERALKTQLAVSIWDYIENSFFETFKF